MVWGTINNLGGFDSAEPTLLGETHAVGVREASALAEAFPKGAETSARFHPLRERFKKLITLQICQLIVSIVIFSLSLFSRYYRLRLFLVEFCVGEASRYENRVLLPLLQMQLP